MRLLIQKVPGNTRHFSTPSHLPSLFHFGSANGPFIRAASLFGKAEFGGGKAASSKPAAAYPGSLVVAGVGTSRRFQER